MLKKFFIILIGFLLLTINTYAETINFYKYHDSSQESINFRQEPSIITTDNIKVKWERDPNNLYNKYNVFFSKFNEDWVLVSDQATINAFNNKYNTYLNIPECEIIETDEYIILTTKKSDFHMV